MTRKLLFLIAVVLAFVSLLVGPSLVPARAGAPPAPVVQTAAARPPLCIIGLPTHAICLLF